MLKQKKTTSNWLIFFKNDYVFIDYFLEFQLHNFAFFEFLVYIFKFFHTYFIFFIFFQFLVYKCMHI